MTEKKIVVLSNSFAGPKFENSLTKFKMSVPPDYLDPHKKWEIGVTKCGIHLQFRNPICSSKSQYPELIQMTIEDFDKMEQRRVLKTNEIEDYDNYKLGMFPEYSKIFLDGSQSYTARQLCQDIQKSLLLKAKMYPESWIGVPVKMSPNAETMDFGHFFYEENLLKLSEGQERNKRRTIVLIHENFKKIINFTSESEKYLRRIKIDDQHYFKCNISTLHADAAHPINSSCEEFNIDKPRLIRIFCPNVHARMVNGDFYQTLKEFSCEDVQEYYQKQFDNIEYHEVHTTQNSSLEISFVDEKAEQLKLLRGLVSYVELSCREMTNINIPISISSEKNVSTPDNEPANFKVILPRPMDFSNKRNVRVALTSLSMSNYFEVLPGAQMDFMVMMYDTEITEFYQFPKNGTIKTLEGIKNWFKAGLNGLVEVIERRTDVYRFLKPICLAIGRDLATILGITYSTNSREFSINSVHLDKDVGAMQYYYFRNPNIWWKKKFEKIAYEFMTHLNPEDFTPSGYKSVKSFFKMGHFGITANQDSELISTHRPRMIKLFPTSLYIYANFIDYSVVSGEYRQLLKVVSLPKTTNSDFTLEFENADYINLNHSVIQNLEFSIKTHDDLNIQQLSNDAVIYMTLNFKMD